MPIICDAINMCKEREEFLSGLGFGKAPNFCPYCGYPWFESAISEKAHAQKEAGHDIQEESALQQPGLSMLGLR